MSATSLIRNPAMKKIIGRFKRMARNGVSILLEGETGTGKNFLAQQAHLLSDRSQGSFLPLICGALPDTLFESELFGLRKVRLPEPETENRVSLKGYAVARFFSMKLKTCRFRPRANW